MRAISTSVKCAATLTVSAARRYIAGKLEAAPHNAAA
jgi:hypothetical protein